MSSLLHAEFEAWSRERLRRDCRIVKQFFVVEGNPQVIRRMAANASDVKEAVELAILDFT
jgi:hypothetical protein